MSLESRTHKSLQPLQKLARFESIGEGTELLLEAFKPFEITGFAGWMALNRDRIDSPGSVISNWPGDWLRSYISGKYYSYDPVVKRATERPGHFFWHDLENDGSPAAMTLMRDAATLGLVAGFTLSWRWAEWRHSSACREDHLNGPLWRLPSPRQWLTHSCCAAYSYEIERSSPGRTY